MKVGFIAALWLGVPNKLVTDCTLHLVAKITLKSKTYTWLKVKVKSA